MAVELLLFFGQWVVLWYNRHWPKVMFALSLEIPRNSTQSCMNMHDALTKTTQVLCCLFCMIISGSCVRLNMCLRNLVRCPNHF